MTVSAKTLDKARHAAERHVDRRIEKIFHARLPGFQINILDIPKVFTVARKAIKAGLDDQAIGDEIVAFSVTL